MAEEVSEQPIVQFQLSEFKDVKDWIKEGVVRDQNFDGRIAFLQLDLKGEEPWTVPVVIADRELARVRITALTTEHLQDKMVALVCEKFQIAMAALSKVLENRKVEASAENAGNTGS